MSIGKYSNDRAFTLVEILVVMVVMGLVIASVYSLSIDTKQRSVTTEAVVDIQQNLRVAMDTLEQDIRMAGFLIPDDQTAISSAPDDIAQDTDDPADNSPNIGTNVDSDGDGTATAGAVFTLQTSSSQRVYARVIDETFASPTITLELEDGMFDLFDSGDEIQVIRPGTRADLGNSWSVAGVSDANNEITISDGTYTAGTVEAGDMVVRKLVGEGDPVANISYWLRPMPDGSAGFQLMRSDGAADDVVSSNITAIDLAYLDETGAATATLEDIRSIRINISTGTDANNFSDAKTRSLEKVVAIRNVNGD